MALKSLKHTNKGKYCVSITTGIFFLKDQKALFESVKSFTEENKATSKIFEEL
jgi:hypothetical protein